MYHAKHPEGQRKSSKEGHFLGFEGNFLFHEKKIILPKKKLYFFS